MPPQFIILEMYKNKDPNAKEALQVLKAYNAPFYRNIENQQLPYEILSAEEQEKFGEKWAAGKF